MESQRLFLIEMTGRHKWRPLAIDCPAVLGRDCESDLPIDYEGVSGKHAKILLDDESYVCEDLNSTNGTRLNNTKISREIIQDGDVLSIGKVNYLVKIVDKFFPRLYFPGEKRLVAIAISPFLIGRSPQGQCAVVDSSVSNLHAKIQYEGDNCSLQDLKSTNGTRVNGQRIRNSRLKDGDRVQFGKVPAWFLCDYMEKNSYSVRFLSGELAGNVLPVLEKQRIGRSEDNDLVIPDSMVSNHHAKIYWENGHYWLKDIRGDNDTRLSGVRIKNALIKHGDEFSIATHSFLFYHNNMSAERYYLVFLGGGRGGEEVLMEKFPFKIGRHASVDLRLADTEASQLHAEIQSQGKSFLIRNLGSTNGTFVNQKKVDSATLEHGDSIRIGSQLLVFRCSTKARPKILQEENYVLLPVMKKGYGKPVLLKPKHNIGRTAENDLEIRSSYVSRQHCVLYNERGDYYVRDCKSALGTWVNGERIAQRKLEHGDEICVGKYNYVFKNSLRPLSKGMFFGIPYWLYGAAIAAVILLTLAIIAVVGLHSSPPKIEEDQAQKRESTTVLSDEQLLSECFGKVAQLQRKYEYRQAKILLNECRNQVSTANESAIDDREKLLDEDYQTFQSIVKKLEAYLERGEKPALQFEGKGSYALKKVSESKLLFQKSREIRLSRAWHELTPKQLFSLMDNTGLSAQEPWLIAKFAQIHGNAEIESGYLLPAFANVKMPVERQEIVARYSQLNNIELPDDPSQVLIYNDRLISLAEHKKILAERERKIKERKALLQEELDKRKQKEDKKLLLRREIEEFPVRLAMAEDLVRTYEYIKAIEELKAYIKELHSAKLKRQVRKKISEIEPMANLSKRLIKDINKRRLSDYRVKFGKVIGELKSADEKRYTVKIGRGTMRQPWYSLPPDDMYQFYSKLSLTADELYLLGVFCFDNNLYNEGNRCFARLLGRAPRKKNEIDRYLAAKLGIPVPEGGFTLYNGRLVSRNEKEKRSQGMVKYHGKWVSPEEKENREAGMIRYKGKWITPDEKKMLAKNYIKYKGVWYKKEQLDKLRREWENAWTFTTDHYEIRCNISGEYIEELGRCLEAACVEYEKFFERKVSQRMKIYAFRTYDDYRDFCTKNGYSSQLRAGGFATSKENLGTGWLRDENKKGTAELLGVMIHEGAHLYQFNAYPSCSAPSWFAEGIATQFESYNWDGKKQKLEQLFSFPRLAWLQKKIPEKDYIPISDLVNGRAVEYINKDPQGAATFYAECWGLYYFMLNSPEYQKRFKKFARGMLNGQYNGRGGQAFLKEFDKDIDNIELKWHKAMLKLDPGKARLELKGF